MFKVNFVLWWAIFLNWISLHARLNKQYEAWSYKKTKMTCREKEKEEPVHAVQMSIYQSNIYRKDSNWLHFGNKDSRGAAPEGVTHTIWCDIIIIYEIALSNF